MLSQRPPPSLWNVAQRFHIVRNHPCHESHQIEGRTVHLDILAQAEHRWHRHIRGGERGDDAMLTPHVVSTLQHMA